MLLHDIAKGRGGDHSELGAEVALKVGPALGLTAEETETVSWLVLHHLLLTDDRIQARHRRSEDHPRPRRHDPVAGAAAPAAGADGRRHARGVGEGVERLEGDAAARALRTGRRGAGRRPVHHRARRARAARQARRRGAAVGLVEAGHRTLHRARLSRLLAVVRSRRRTRATPAWCATPRRARRR